MLEDDLAYVGHHLFPCDLQVVVVIYVLFALLGLLFELFLSEIKILFLKFLDLLLRQPTIGLYRFLFPIKKIILPVKKPLSDGWLLIVLVIQFLFLFKLCIVKVLFE
jgi:hypothetical protein